MKTKSLLSVLAAAILITSCSKSENPNPVDPDPTPGVGKYIVAVTPIASTGVADYLVTSNSLDDGKVSIIGNGIEQDGTWRYYLSTNNKFFSFLYGQGNPGAVTAYNLENGKLKKLTNFQSETVAAFAAVNDDVLMAKMSRNLATPTHTWYRVNTNSLSIVGEGSMNALELANNGEIGYFSWLTQVGNKVYAPFFCIESSSFTTKYPNKAWVAVFSYPDMKLEKVFTDERTSYIGQYFTNGLGTVENGDIYAFSAANATSKRKDDPTKSEITTTNPSAILKISSGTTEFDKNYFFNVTEISGGYNIVNWTYVGGNNFIVSSKKKQSDGSYSAETTIAAVNVVDKTFKTVTGLPNASEIKSFTQRNNYSKKDGKIGYIGVNLKSGKSYVYKIDATAATATTGLEVEGGSITAIEHLD
ncbi:DUF4374 domain-containing protein [Sphingobacterium prati]|uniref:DUF4374 domain-containing protein n=1 Tax=Sphingobacterium prati TaxID=2737006 RepID=UPI0015560559|nr:DUF4374 domain-containing protein [Sphingobacterium prati]NPE45836.1 DUF4374 domain-containing protein [Sphingobacterium prati]